jgi:hypothetical protein
MLKATYTATVPDLILTDNFHINGNDKIFSGTVSFSVHIQTGAF